MNVKVIEAAIAQLTSRELAELPAWMLEHQAKVWDRQIEEDPELGRLDALLDEAGKAYRAGKANPI
jgi:hypothetical protein